MALKQVYLLHHISVIHLSNIGQISEKNICYSIVYLLVIVIFDKGEDTINSICGHVCSDAMRSYTNYSKYFR